MPTRLGVEMSCPVFPVPVFPVPVLPAELPVFPLPVLPVVAVGVCSAVLAVDALPPLTRLNSHDRLPTPALTPGATVQTDTGDWQTIGIG